MRILHLASGNRWTGAAATAFAEVEALRQLGFDAHYAYVGGYKLEAKIGHLAWAHAAIEKPQNPAAFLRSLRRLADLGRFDWVHAHLTYDHVLAAALTRRSGAHLARTFHARRAVRGDVLSHLLIRRTRARFAVNAALGRAHGFVFTPPPLDERQFSSDGPTARATYGLAPDTPVVATIGKVASGRGFELVLRAFARIHREIPASRLLIIGHGPLQPELERMAHALTIEEAVVWAGYHEDDLAEHYRAADVLLFAERGSDEGHRAVIEAMACGVIPIASPIEGIEALMGEAASRLVAPRKEPDSLAEMAIPLLRQRPGSLRHALVKQSRIFGYDNAAKRLIDAYRTRS